LIDHGRRASLTHMPRAKTTQLTLLDEITRMDQDENPYIGYSTWALTQCTLPYQNPKPDVRVWARCSAPGLMETSKPGRNTSDARTEEGPR
jgi:hypothetical protein